MSAMYILIAITDRKKTDKFLNLFREYHISMIDVLLGEGTATSAVLDYLNLQEESKSVILAPITAETLKPLLKQCRNRLYIDIPGNGIVVTVPINSVGGRRSLAMMAANQELKLDEEKVGEKSMVNTEHELIMVVSNEGYTDLIMDAARSAHAGGGTVLKAKGTGGKFAQKFLGLSIADEKEITLIVSTARDRNDIMKAIMEKAGQESPAKAIAFSLPVSTVAGLRSME